jgi:protein-disulfide isomerase
MNRPLAALGLGCLLAGPARASPPASKKPAVTQATKADPAGIAPSSVIATIDGQPITYAEVDGPIADALTSAKNDYLTQTYELRRGALDQAIMKRLVEAETKKLGKTPAAWLEEDFLAKVPEPTDEEVQRAYEAVKADLGGATLEQSKDRLRQQLRLATARERFMARLQELANGHVVRVLMVPPEPLRLKVEAKGPSRGDPKAKVTIVEFGDFQCPYCRETAARLGKLLDAYPGKVRLVFRQFPLDSHPEARKSAEASLCAADQGKFWELHDRLYKDASKPGAADLNTVAKELGLDVEKLEACVSRGEHKPAVDEDLLVGRGLGVQGTPTFFVNGVLVAGALSYDDLKAVVDRELAGIARK